MSMGSAQQPQPYLQRTYKGGWLVQTATFKAVPVVYGTQRVAGNLMWMGDRQTVVVQQGKGGLVGASTKSGGETFYNEGLIFCLSEGPILGIGRVWRTSNSSSVVKPANVTRYWTIVPGNLGQSPLGYFTTNHPGMDIGYSGLAYAWRQEQPLGTSTTPPQFTWEVYGHFVININTNPDANPADIVTDMLTNTQYGGFFQPSWITSLATWRQYCTANSLFLSMVCDTSTKLSEYLDRLMKITNSDIRWHDGQLDVVPFGDLIITGNGQTFTPELTPVYTFTKDDFIKDKQPSISITRPADIYNQFPIEFLNRANSYDPESMYSEIQDQVQLYGVRRAPVLTAHEICNPLVARLVVTTQMTRSISVYREYSLTVPWTYFLLEPLDIVGFVDTDQGIGAGYGMSTGLGSDGGGTYITFAAGTLVRAPVINEYVVDRSLTPQHVVAVNPGSTTTKVYVTSISGMTAGDQMVVSPMVVRVNEIKEDQKDAYLELTCEDLGVNTPLLYGTPHQPRGSGPHGSSGTNPNDINPPVIFEPNYPLAVAEQGRGQIWFATSGSISNDANYGGCQVWMSRDGGSSYIIIGTMYGNSTMGVLSANLATGPDPDTSNTLALDLSESNGIISSLASTALADAGQNLCMVDNEIMTFANVSPGPTYSYNCTYLRRGFFSSTVAAHGTGAPFVFIGTATTVDSSIFRWSYITEDNGATLYFKFPSFNQDGSQLEDLSTVTAYTYTITGTSILPPPSGGFPVAPGMPDPTNLIGLVTNKGDLKLRWDFSINSPAAVSSGFDHFEILVGNTLATTTEFDNTKRKKEFLITDPPPGLNTYWVAAMNYSGAIDPSPPSVTVNVVVPNSVTGLTATITKKGDVQLKWTRPNPFPAHFKSYEIRLDANPGVTANFVDHTKQTKYLIVDPPCGVLTYYVYTLDMAGNYSSPATVVATTLCPAPVTSLTAAITKKGDVRFAWIKPSPFPGHFRAYEVRTDTNPGNATNLVDHTKLTHYVFIDPPAGTYTYYVYTEDHAGNFSTTAPSVTITVPAPAPPTGLTAVITKKADLRLTWSKPSPFPGHFKAYEIRLDTNPGNDTNFLDHTKQQKHLFTDPPTGTNTYYVYTLDMAGNYSTTAPSVVATVPAPASVTGAGFRVTKKQDVQIFWTRPNPLPAHFRCYELRYDTNPGTAINMFDQTKKTQYLLVDWATNVTIYIYVLDHAGNYSAPAPVVITAPSSGGAISSAQGWYNEWVAGSWNPDANNPTHASPSVQRLNPYTNSACYTKYPFTNQNWFMDFTWEPNGASSFDAFHQNASGQGYLFSVYGPGCVNNATIYRRDAVGTGGGADTWVLIAVFGNTGEGVPAETIRFQMHHTGDMEIFGRGALFCSAQDRNYQTNSVLYGSWSSQGGTPPWISTVQLNGGHYHTPAKGKQVSSKHPVQHGTSEHSFIGLTTDPTDVARQYPPNRRPLGGPIQTSCYAQLGAGGQNRNWEVTGTFELIQDASQGPVLEFYSYNPAGTGGYVYQFYGFPGWGANVALYRMDGAAGPPSVGTTTALAFFGGTGFGQSVIAFTITEHQTGHHEIYTQGSLNISVLDKTYTTSGTIYCDQLGGVAGANAYVSALKLIGGQFKTPAGSKQPASKHPVQHGTSEHHWVGLITDPTNASRQYPSAQRVPPSNANPGTTFAQLAVDVNQRDWEITGTFENISGGTGQGPVLGIYYPIPSNTGGYVIQIYGSPGWGSYINLYRIDGNWNFSAGSAVLIASWGGAPGFQDNYKTPFVITRHSTGHHEVYVQGAIVISVLDNTYPSGNWVYADYYGTGPGGSVMYVSNLKLIGGHFKTPFAHKSAVAKAKRPQLQHKWGGLETDPTNATRMYTLGNRSHTAGGGPDLGTSLFGGMIGGGDWAVHVTLDVIPGNQAWEIFQDNGSGQGYLFQFLGAPNSYNAVIDAWNGSSWTFLGAWGNTGIGGSNAFVVKRHHTGDLEIFCGGAIVLAIINNTYGPSNYLEMMEATTAQPHAYFSQLRVVAGHMSGPYQSKEPGTKTPKKQIQTQVSNVLTAPSPYANWLYLPPGSQRGNAPVLNSQVQFSSGGMGRNVDISLQLTPNPGGWGAFEIFLSDGAGHGYLWEIFIGGTVSGGPNSSLWRNDGGTAWIGLGSEGGTGYGGANTFNAIAHTGGYFEFHNSGTPNLSCFDNTYGLAGGQIWFSYYANQCPYFSNVHISGGHFKSPYAHKNPSTKKMLTAGLDPGSATGTGKGVSGPNFTYNPPTGFYSTSSGTNPPPIGVWAALSGQPSPNICQTNLSVATGNDTIKGHLLIDMNWTNYQNNDSVWTQVVNDANAVMHGPSNITSLVSSAPASNINTKSAGGPFDFNDSPGAHTYTAQFAIGNAAGGFSVTVIRASLTLTDHRA